MLDNTPNQPSKLKIENLVEINGESYRVCNIGSQIKFKTSMLRSSLCEYSDVYILPKGTITFIYETNNTEIDHAKDIDIVIPMYNLIEYGYNCFINIWKVMAIL